LGVCTSREVERLVTVTKMALLWLVSSRDPNRTLLHTSKAPHRQTWLFSLQTEHLAILVTNWRCLLLIAVCSSEGSSRKFSFSAFLSPSHSPEHVQRFYLPYSERALRYACRFTTGSEQHHRVSSITLRQYNLYKVAQM
jgi:hypothetical protein